MTPDERDEIMALAEQVADGSHVEPPCPFVLTGYPGSPHPCQLEAHDRQTAHDCGPYRVSA